MKKLFLFILVGLFLINFSTAGLFDPGSELAFHEDGKSGNYGYYEINDTTFWFFNNKPVKTIELLENEYSVFTAWNIKEIEVFKPTKLFDKTNYLDKEQEKDRRNLLSSETHLYREWEINTRVIINKSCLIYETLSNQTQVCSEWGENLHEEEYEGWSDWKIYKFQTVQKGLYQTKTVVTRSSQNTGVIDWVDENEGYSLGEWETWWDNDWDKKRLINLTSNVGNFSYIQTINFSADMQSDFIDLRFIDSATESIELNYTIESFIASTSVRVRVDSQGEDSFYVYYGNVAVSSNSNAGDTYMGANAVYFLDETTGDAIDSEGGRNGTVTGATQGVAGQINNSYFFIASTADTLIADSSVTGDTTVTSMGWFKRGVSTGNTPTMIMINVDGVSSTASGWGLVIRDGIGGKVSVLIQGVALGTESAIAYNDGAWHSFMITRSGSTYNAYIDGGSSVISTTTNGGGSFSDDIMIGSRASTVDSFGGEVDEIYIFPDVKTTDDFLRYHTQTEPNYTVGVEETNVGVVTTLISPENNQNILNNTINFNFTSTPIQTNLTNATLYIWMSNGTLVDTNFTTLSGNESVNTTLTNTLIDGMYKWNAETCGEGVSCSFASSNNSFIVHVTPITIDITEPNGTIQLIKIGNNETLSWVLSELGENLTEHVSNCSYAYNSVITLLPLNTCVVTNTTGFEYVLGVDTLTFITTDAFNLTSNETTTWDYQIIETNQTFNNITTEGATEEFIINFIKQSSAQISTVDLIYNGTSNSFSYSVSDDNVTSFGSITIPGITLDTNVTFFWNITLSDGSSIITSSNNQTILSIDVDNCSVFSNLIYNFTQYDEENQTILGGNNTIELQINLHDTRKTTLLANFSNSFTGVNPVQFCTEDSILLTVNYSSYVIVKYFVNDTSSGQSYSVEYYNILNQTIGNLTVPKNIALYNLRVDDTTKFRLTFRDEEYVLSPNILVQVHRQYIKDNDFKIVEIPLTDSNGQTILNLVRNTIIYNFIMVDEARNIVGTFNSIAAFCSDFSIGDCTINLAPDSLSEDVYDYNEEFDISISSPSYDNSTEEITISFVTRDLTAKSVSMQVVRNNQFGNRSVCSDTLLSASGILSCDVSSVTDTDQFLFISVFVEEELAEQDTINLNSDILNFGTLNGAFYAFFLILILITLFMEDRKVLVVSLGLGWVCVISLGLINGKFIGFTSAGIWILISIAIFLWKLNDEDSQ